MLDEPLVTVKSSRLLLVDPIWQNPIDEIEGPLYREYMQVHPDYNAVYVRQSVAAMLKQAAKNLPARFQLILRAGHRPQEVQLRLLEMVKDRYLHANPKTTEATALAFARTYVSDPAIKLPPHCCGAAVDVDVLDRVSDALVDFGCPVNTDDEIAFLDSEKISRIQKGNRQMLVSAMTRAGFAPFAYEWWHFSYGDQTWADNYGKNGKLYGLIEPDLERL